MKNFRYFIIWILTFGTLHGLSAQDTLLSNLSDTTAQNLQIIGQYDGTQINLRWAPGTPGAWFTGNQKGYIIERMEVDTTAPLYPERLQPLLPTPLLPAPLSDWSAAATADSSNKYVLVGAECIHSDWLGLHAPFGYQDRAEELTNRWSSLLFAADMDPLTAELAALRFTDTTVEADKEYLYRIHCPADTGDYYVAPAIIFVDTRKAAILPQPILGIPTENEGEVSLHWNRSWHEKHFTAYQIERSEDGGNHFKSLEVLPYVHGVGENLLDQSELITYSDSIPNYVPFQYRIRGISPFGEWSEPSMAIEAMARDRTPPAQPKEVKTQWIAGKGMAITWSYLEEASDLEGFRVGRSDRFSGEYQVINSKTLDPSRRSFVDIDLDGYTTQYYIVLAVDTAKNVNASLVTTGFIPDTIPPDPVTGLKGTIDSIGTVQLNWDRGPERDLLGYHVFFANDSTHTFARITNEPIKTFSYKDSISLNTLTRHVHYRLVAVDTRYNHSVFSNILSLERPDTIPPTPPIFTTYNADNNGVLLHWAKSNSEDVQQHLLYRKKDEEEWRQLKNFVAATEVYLDTLIEPGHRYSYRIQAIDHHGLISRELFPITVSIPNIKWMSESPDVEIYKEEDKLANRIKWRWPSSQIIISTLIFRAIDDGPFQPLIKLTGQHSDYIDKNISSGQKYAYTIQLVSTDGKKSAFSRIISVQQ